MVVWQIAQITSSRGLGATGREMGAGIGAASKSSETSFIKSAIMESRTSVSCLFLIDGLLAPDGLTSARESVSMQIILKLEAAFPFTSICIQDISGKHEP